MFTKTTLDGQRENHHSQKEEVERHNWQQRQWEDLGACERIERVTEQEIPMDIKEPLLIKLVEIVKKARAAYAHHTSSIKSARKPLLKKYMETIKSSSKGKE